MLALLTACGAVDVPRNDLRSADRSACTALVRALPQQVSDQERRTTEGNPFAAAWGDPAIVLRCGVAPPRGYDRFASCQTVNDVDWFVPQEAIEDQGADVVMTTIGREPGIEVVLPATYRPPANAMVDLAATVQQHTKLVKRCG